LISAVLRCGRARGSLLSTGAHCDALKIDPPTLRDDLLEFLRGSGCLALTEGSNAIETQLLNSVSDRHNRAVLAGLVESGERDTPGRGST